MKLALHTCCAPCLIGCIDWFLGSDGTTVDGEPFAVDDVRCVYYNPNIGPADEYARRRDTFADYAIGRGLDWVELEYEPDAWWRAIGDDRRFGVRCAGCYRVRFERVADWAAAAGYDTLATTLAISPWQNLDAINATGRAAAATRGLRWLACDLRPLYRAGQQRAREMGIYRQKYCGCELSLNE
ncbi:MAG: epoxyqueuosine reductase QueH [Actinomycetes bacterium]|jgi:predicted adenine nucleotide alpha hydrolase (AANH) superfamily ATPase|nr:epoxyqueuosine reductase QueH [Actinomycetes bacterium]